MVLDLEPKDVITLVGHDGSDEPYKETGRKAGFHEQECIEVAARLGYACTPIEAVPTISPYVNLGHADPRPIYFDGGLAGNRARLLHHMDGTCGVLTGTYTNRPGDPYSVRGHAVAWDGITTQKIHDPLGPRCYPFAEADKYGFTPGCFWKVQHVQVHG
jgi:hypothetical protein